MSDFKGEQPGLPQKDIASQQQEAALEKARNILDGDLFVHYTKMSKIPGILRHGLLSQQAAKQKGEEIETEWPTKSNPEYVYVFDLKSEEITTEDLLFVLGRDISVWDKTVEVLILKEGVVTQPALPFISQAFPELQRMIKHSVPLENIVGLTIGGRENKDGHIEIEPYSKNLLIKQIQTATKVNPQYAVAVYNQRGDMLWPVEKKREEILKR